jgi:putative SOS response-associated peptidase YedK
MVGGVFSIGVKSVKYTTMCGRYVAPSSADIERFWAIARRNVDPFAARYNVAPTTSVPILRRDPEDGALTLTQACVLPSISMFNRATPLAPERCNS